MRFDDMLATVLAREPDRLSARVAQWRQLLDLLAHRPIEDDSDLLHLAVARFVALRAEVPVAIRRESAETLVGRAVPPGLVALVATDTPSVAGAMLSRVTLDDLDWLELIPRLTPTTRAYLRLRDDLGPHVRAALAGFGATDLVLTGTVGAVGPDTAPPVVLEAEAMREDLPAPADDAAPDEPAFAAGPEWDFVEAAPEVEEPAPLVVAEAVAEEAPPVNTVPPVEDAPLVEDVPAVEDAPPIAEAPSAPDDEPHEPMPAPDADEPAPAGQVLAFFGQAEDEEQHELPLPGAQPAVEPFDPDSGQGQIRAIISRIDRFRSGRDDALPPLAEVGAANLFRFETGPDGVIRWIDGVPRGALIGETIARAGEGPYGVDAQAPGAFLRRAPFRDARLTVAGAGHAAGAWRIAGVPVFASADGRFLGYRGTGRRALADAQAEPVAAATATGDADSLRQLVHELRTPLNAIGGFAEMIRRQMRGPVSEPYRDRAQGIAEQAGRLMVAVDDLDVSARLDGARTDFQRLPVALPTLVAPLCGEQAELAQTRGIAFDPALPLDLPAVLGDAAAIRRMVARLLSAAAALTAPGEALRLTGAADGEGVTIAVTRPARLSAVPDGDLFDPGYGPEGESPDAPLLGLGFSLHLVRRLASAIGAQLLVDPSWFTLRFVVAEPSGDSDAG